MRELTLRDSLQAALASAMRERDGAVVAAVRSALSAVANAEAVSAPDSLPSATGSVHVAGAVQGLGTAETRRAVISERRQRELVAAEAAELAEHATRLEASGRHEEARAAQRAARVLRELLADK